MVQHQDELPATGSVNIYLPGTAAVTTTLVANRDPLGKVAVRHLDVDLAGGADTIDIAWKDPDTGTTKTFRQYAASGAFTGNVLGPAGYDLVAIGLDGSGSVSGRVAFEAAITQRLG